MLSIHLDDAVLVLVSRILASPTARNVGRASQCDFLGATHTEHGITNSTVAGLTVDPLSSAPLSISGILTENKLPLNFADEYTGRRYRNTRKEEAADDIGGMGTYREADSETIRIGTIALNLVCLER